MPPTWNGCHSCCTRHWSDGADMEVSGRTSYDPDHDGSIDEDLVVKDLNGLTAVERERIYEELHGIVDIVEETPDVVAESLRKMRQEIASTHKKQKKAWERAVYLRPSIEKDDNLHLMFLRAERFDPAKAAAKLCRYFEHKRELFGDSKLVERITLDDLNEDAKSLFETGSAQFLTSNDRSGRGIYLMTPTALGIHHWKTIVRYAWYIIHSAIEDNEEIQKRGVVQVMNLMGNWRYPPAQILETVRAAHHIVSDWPFRQCGLHICYDDVVLRSLFHSLALVCGKELRIRQRTHFGSSLEVQYSLMTFGVSLSNAFTPNHGIMSNEHIRVYLQQRQEIEEEWKRREQGRRDANRDFCERPIELDVLMGRSQMARTWRGNQLFSSLSQEYANRYKEDLQLRLDKTMMAFEVVQRIQLVGGRFVKRTVDGWTTVSDQVAKEKANQTLRAEARRRRATEGQLPCQSTNRFQ